MIIEKEKWKIVKLGEVAKIISGSTPKTHIKEYWNGELFWVTPAEINSNTILINETKKKITQKAILETSMKPFPSGTVLLSSRAPIGKVAIANTEMYCNQGFKNLICNESLYNKYLFWYLKGKTEFLNSLGRGATFKEISKTIVEKIEIPLPPIEIQKYIAKTLDTASELITLHKKQLKELDSLIKSTFYNMFGDPVTNDMGWEVKKLSDLSTLITKGSSPNWQGINYVEDNKQVLFITSENVREGYLDLTKEKYLENKFNDIQPRSILKRNDILINIVGASIGRSAIFTLDKKTNINQAVALVRCKKDIVLKYLSFYLNSPKAIQMYKNMQVDVARANLSLKNIGDLSILFPPLPLQQQFAEIVTKIEEQKNNVKKSINESQYLFDSLMIKYF